MANYYEWNRGLPNLLKNVESYAKKKREIDKWIVQTRAYREALTDAFIRIAKTEFDSFNKDQTIDQEIPPTGNKLTKSIVSGEYILSFLALKTANVVPETIADNFIEDTGKIFQVHLPTTWKFLTSLVANNVRKNWESTSKLEEVKRATRLQTEALPISMAINILSYTYNQTLRLTQTHVGMALQSYSVPQSVQETLQRLDFAHLDAGIQYLNLKGFGDDKIINFRKLEDLLITTRRAHILEWVRERLPHPDPLADQEERRNYAAKELMKTGKDKVRQTIIDPLYNDLFSSSMRRERNPDNAIDDNGTPLSQRDQTGELWALMKAKLGWFMTVDAACEQEVRIIKTAYREKGGSFQIQQLKKWTALAAGPLYDCKMAFLNCHLSDKEIDIKGRHYYPSMEREVLGIADTIRHDKIMDRQELATQTIVRPNVYLKGIGAIVSYDINKAKSYILNKKYDIDDDLLEIDVTDRSAGEDIDAPLDSPVIMDSIGAYDNDPDYFDEAEENADNVEKDNEGYDDDGNDILVLINAAQVLRVRRQDLITDSQRGNIPVVAESAIDEVAALSP
ncbi:hypothetical protein ACHAO1_011079 [Botrytis cinerea]